MRLSPPVTGNTSFYSAIASRDKIDGSAGIIHGVSVITEGEAQGRNSGTWIDRTTLTQIKSVAGGYPDGVKVKLSQNKEHDGSAGQIVGTLKNFKIDGDKLRADLHLLKASKSFDFIIEMANTMPSEFGLSVVVPNEKEEKGDKKFLRCSEIFSIDIVEAPAANEGLFSSKSTQDINMSIKYAKGDSGDHAKDCDCKECMSKHSKKEMSAFMASVLGLPETATEDEMKAKVATLSAGKQTDLTELTAKLAKLEEGNANALALSQKAEIDNLVVEASRSRKVIPFDTDDLYTVTDGKVAIKMLPTQLSKVISKLAPTVAFSRKQVEAPKTADGKPITDAQARVEFCLQKQKEGAVELSQFIRRQANPATN